MNLHSSLALRRKFYLWVSIILTLLSACARKNRRVYDFRLAQASPALRVALPYIKKLDVSYDKEVGQYILTWEPLILWSEPGGERFFGYNLYQATEMRLFTRQPFLQVPPGVHSSVALQCCTTLQKKDFLFGIAPVFFDKEGNEMIGLMTVKKIPPT